MPNTRSDRKSDDSGEQSEVNAQVPPETPVKEQAELSLPTPESSGSKKRKLEGDEDEDAHAPMKKSARPYNKHETHWNLDGSLLVQLGKTRFRIHRSRLVSESAFFRALIGQHNGVFPEDPYPRQNEIDQILATAEDVDGTVLFFLDAGKVTGGTKTPNAKQFAIMLTAMNEAINFAYEPPTEDVFALLRASAFYEMTTYTNYCRHFIMEIYPDVWEDLSDEPSIDFAVKGLRLNTSHPDILEQIRRPVFYELARAPFYLNSETEDNGEDTTGSKKPSERKALESLTRADLVTLLDLQKRLRAAWDDIILFMAYTCKGPQCTKHHSKGLATAMSISKEFPYDPITGVGKLLDRMNLSSFYCPAAAKEVKRRLELEYQAIWDDFGQWVNLNDRDSDNDS